MAGEVFENIGGKESWIKLLIFTNSTNKFSDPNIELR